ncbi:hypothetical protein HK103_002012 [Boothiomyces macroporosus]|uniref:Zn(2)-C6 fungal-type domain-containing protein n=1 Tax=Boothiomyces macroporosus TaxID=261099 RepID=A0AAD5U9T0_9FUNG|nr:hypothetical protein HK103_002012 [Boothiomyces macroporosus]
MKQKRNNNPCIVCRQRKVKCDGKFPCSKCTLYQKSMYGKNSTCRYEDAELSHSATNSSDYSANDEHVQEVSPEMTQYDYPGFVDSNESLFDPDQFVFEFQLSAPKFNITELQQSELETHLISLSFLYYCGFCCTADNFSVIPMNRPEPMSKLLKNAVCYASTFYSNHPLLFHSPPTFKERYEAAQRFDIDISMMKPIHEYKTNLELCDDIRALLLHSSTQEMIGNRDRAFELFHAVYILGKKYKIFNPNEYHELESHQISIDDLITQVDSLGIQFGDLSPRDVTERYTLYLMAFTIDTHLAIAKGDNFIIDETLYPDINVNDTILDTFFDYSNKIHGIFSSYLSRQFEPSKAKNTVWENTIHADIFDECKENSTKFTYFLPNAKKRVQGQIKRLKFFREIIKFSRLKKYEPKLDTDAATRRAFHDQLLSILASFPGQAVMAKSLKTFIVPSIKSLREVYSVQMTILSMFSYLHLSAILHQDDTLYPLELGGPEVSPKEILLASFKAACHVVDVATGSQNVLNENSVCSPLIATPMIAFFQFCICTTLVIAFRDNQQVLQSVKADMKKLVLLIKQIGEFSVRARLVGQDMEKLIARI